MYYSVRSICLQAERKKNELEICTYHALVSHLGPLNLGSAHHPQSGDSMQKLQSSEVLSVQAFFLTVSVLVNGCSCWALVRPIKAISSRSNALCMFRGQLRILKCLVFCSYWTKATLLILGALHFWASHIYAANFGFWLYIVTVVIAQFSHCNSRQDGWVFETKMGG